METLKMLRSVYGEETLSRKTVFQWFKRFREGRESVVDEHRSGRPVKSRTTANIERVRKLFLPDRRLSVRIMANELNLPREIVRTILTKDLGKLKLCATFVPHKLNDEQNSHLIPPILRQQTFSSFHDWNWHWRDTDFQASQTLKLLLPRNWEQSQRGNFSKVSRTCMNDIKSVL